MNLTLACFSKQKIAQKQINWTGRTGSFSQETVEMGVVYTKVGMALNFCTCFAHKTTIEPPLQEILDPPLALINSKHLFLVLWYSC